MADNLSRIVAFFQSKGVPGYIIAGIVGNMSVESGFNPQAHNGAEGAIGLVQWEGGRRTALQAWAHAHGGTESELDMQLGFLWHEMHTGESSAWQQVQRASNVYEAASLWDQYYERSSGSSRQDRIDRAVQFMNTHDLPSGSNQGGGAVPDGNGGGGGGGGGLPDMALTRADLHSVDSLGNLLDSVPQLSQLVNKALNNGWSLNKFENAVENTDWWKNHSDTARQVLIQQANDPASYAQSLHSAEFSIKHLATQLGFNLNPNEIEGIANHALLTGNSGNTDWLTQQIGAREDYSHIGNRGLNNLDGQMATNVQQLQQLAYAYGLKWDPNDLAHKAKLITLGNQTIDAFAQQAKDYAKSAFPSFAKQIDGGQTMMDIANPYISSASQLLEMDPSKFDLYNPLIRKGLQGVSAKPGEPPSNMPIWAFENLVTQNPRWQYTDNARAEAAQTLMALGQNWGING